MSTRGVPRISKPIEPSFGLDLDDDDGWQDMPIVRELDPNLALDEEDQQKYHYVTPSKSRLSSDQGPTSNATGNLIDFDEKGQEWREKITTNEEEYTRLKLDEDEDADDGYLRTKYLFDEDKAMTPLSQMQATKNLLTEAQRIAYVGLCSLVTRQMIESLSGARRKEFSPAIKALELWRMRIMGRIYYHMELETAEQKMIESLGDHGVDPLDLVPALMTTHTVANPEYDPAAAHQKRIEDGQMPIGTPQSSEYSGLDVESTASPKSSSHQTPLTPTMSTPAHGVSLLHAGQSIKDQTTANVLQPNEATSIPGVSTHLSSTDENVTLDIRWTVLCDLFLILIADSVYDARSRALLENVAVKLGLGWLDVVRFEKRVTDALEIEERTNRLEHEDVIEGRSKAAQRRRYMMVGLATLGGGLVLGLSAGLLAPVIGAGLGAAFATIGVSGTSAFLTGVGGAAVITTGGVLTGSGIAAKGMSKRTRQVRTFDLLPLHNNKRVSCTITIPGFMSGAQDDVRLPFSVLDSIVGDVFSVRWEPEMMGEMGDALKILTSEVLSQLSTTVLQATVMTALMSALQWPIVLSKLGYLIDNPWSNALDRARAAGGVLADILLNRSLGVRPLNLIGFSLGARVIFYALIELAKHKAFGIVQDVFLLGATLTAPQKTWIEARGVVAGRFVNGFARNDWVLNYLFRATTGGGTVAGLRPVQGVPGLENVDVTDKISGHMSYRVYMPVILDQLGFPVTATYFDEPEEPDMEYDREVIRDEESAVREAAKKKRFTLFSNKTAHPQTIPSSTPAASTKSSQSTRAGSGDEDDNPVRIERPSSSADAKPNLPSPPAEDEAVAHIPAKAGFDFKAIANAIGKGDLDPSTLPIVPSESVPSKQLPDEHVAPGRTGSAPLPLRVGPPDDPSARTPKPTTLPLPDQLPSSADEDHSLPTVFQRSLSMSDASAIRGDSDSKSDVPSSEDFYNPLTISKTPSWPPPSALTSPAPSEGPIWGSSPANGYSAAVSGPSISNPGPLQRQAPPSISFGALNGVVPPATIVGSSTPELSFGSADGSIVPVDGDAMARDPWAPKPIGLDAAIARKTNYTLNPWET